MKKFLIGFWITTGAMAITVATVFLLRLDQKTINLFAMIILASIVIAIAGCFVFVGAVGKQKYRKIKAEADEAEYEAKAKSYVYNQDGFGMGHLLNLKTDQVENLSTYPGSHHNGKWEEPPEKAMMAWFALVARNKSIAEEAVSQLVIEQKPNLDNLIDQYPHIWEYGGTGSGKTSLLRYIAHRRKAQGHDVVILDSKEHPSKWIGLTRIREFEKINQTIQKVYQIHRDNSDALSTGSAIEEEFKQITIISDEWTSIVRNSELAQRFTDEMTREARKTGIHLVIATQTNLADDIGLSGRYRVVGGFLQIELAKLPNEKYIAKCKVANKSLGEFEPPEPLPTPNLLPAGYNAPSLENVEIKKQTYIPTREEKIISLIQEGASNSDIAQEVFSKPSLSGDNFYLVKRLRDEISP